MPLISLETPIAQLKSMRGYFAERLKKLGVETVKDLFFHFPYRYEDFSRITPIAELTAGTSCTVSGIVEKIELRKIWRRRMTITEARISDGTGKLSIVWFNQSYVAKSLPKGAHANFAGRVTEKDGRIQLTNPLYEPSENESTKHTARIVPVYRETKGLTSRGIRFIVQPILNHVRVPETLPVEMLEKENLPGREDALRAIHFPENLGAAYHAKARFAFEELLTLSVHMGLERKRIEAKKAFPLPIEAEEIKELLKLVPFELTESQKHALWETAKDLGRGFPMHRLLQGDVGSGKTIVAALAAVLAAQKGFQAAMMAPTEILARQHYGNLTRLFGELETGIALLTASEARVFYGAGLETVMTKPALEKEIKKGAVKIVVGTHALLNRRSAFKNLVLAVVDEQHRFGVSQRAKLLEAETGKVVPHFLSMSATPIPRTMSLVLFADLDLSLITELPKDRKPIETRLVPKDERKSAYEFIKKEIATGRQAFVICPRIEPPEAAPLTEKEEATLEAKSVKLEYEKLAKKTFPDLRVGMLHGKMKPAEKEKVMGDFSARKIDILVSTSVIEVGIDVPNATVMMVEDADRFGLAQLYQFRGRVGRGMHQSHCLLFTEKEDEKTQERLRYLEKAKNGFELAEYDLKDRGPGELFGLSQSGFPDLAMSALQNPRLLKHAKEYADEILRTDPRLDTVPEIKRRITEFAKTLHRE
jgi:ATP-dependent DNA helicase RecG